MKVTYFYPARSTSIKRVFQAFNRNVNDRDELDEPCEEVTPMGIFRNLLFTFRNRNRGGGINHVAGGIHYCCLALPAKNTILTIHDTVSLNYYKQNKIKYLFIYFFWYYLPLKHIKYITSISPKTKEELGMLFPWCKSKIVFIPNALSPGFIFSPATKFSEIPRILHIGTRENKNLKRVIKALDGLPCHLRIIGKINKEIKSLLLEHKVEYSNNFNLTDQEILLEYKKCDIVSFPSLYEGFGMPIIEGQAIGRPVITSNLSPMKEIAGGGACLVNPCSVESIKNGFLKIISDETYRKDIINCGLDNVRHYNKDSVSSQYISLYHKLVNIY